MVITIEEITETDEDKIEVTMPDPETSNLIDRLKQVVNDCRQYPNDSDELFPVSDVAEQISEKLIEQFGKFLKYFDIDSAGDEGILFFIDHDNYIEITGTGLILIEFKATSHYFKNLESSIEFLEANFELKLFDSIYPQVTLSGSLEEAA